jgi:hypothetical protein
MTMDTVQLEEARALARALVAVLPAGDGWVKKLRQLASRIEAGDIEGAVEVRASLQPGMGGFDEFLEANPPLQKPYGDLSRAVGSLKLASRYGIHRS